MDAGAGQAPYAPLFAHARYETADFEKLEKDYAESTYVCDLADIPVEDGRFDAVVFNQVMEHLPDPASVLSELHRVLKPGGRMIYTGPLFYEEHETPYDYFRYTRYGLRHLFSEAGFTIERLDWLEGYLGTVAYQLNRIGRNLPVSPADLGGGLAGLALAPVALFTRLSAAVLAPLFHRAEVRAKYTRRGYPKNYVAILRKEASE